MISTACPHCNRKMQAPEKLLDRQVKCPSCQTPFTVRRQIAAIAAAPASPPLSIERPSKGWRFLSLPWLITVLLFGFLPWCEISCHKTEIRLTQSGYQAVYGNVSLPPGVEDALVKQAERTSLNLEATREQLGFERSYLANVSPFLIFFWSACICLIVIICSVPLGGLRLGFTLPLAGVMLVTLIVHAAIGLPLERRFGLVMGEFLEALTKCGGTFLTCRMPRHVENVPPHFVSASYEKIRSQCWPSRPSAVAKPFGSG